MRFIVITAQVVGGDETPMRIEHYWDGQEFGRRQDAVSHGFKFRESDDFNIGHVSQGELRQIWWMDEDLHEPPETLREIGQEIGLR